MCEREREGEREEGMNEEECVCMHVQERERERGGGDREREGDRDKGVCVYVCMGVCNKEFQIYTSLLYLLYHSKILTLKPTPNLKINLK